MQTAALVFPNQLFENHPVLDGEVSSVFLIEHPLFFGDAEYPLQFHKQKLAYHRATMAAYCNRLNNKGLKCSIVQYTDGTDQLTDFCNRLKQEGNHALLVADVHDDVLLRRLRHRTDFAGIALTILDTPGFLNQNNENSTWRKSRKRWFMADYYQWQRRRLGILMEGDKPVGGKWSFDEDNRKKLPKKSMADVPILPPVKADAIVEAAVTATQKQFPENPGSLEQWYYPITTDDAKTWLRIFLHERLHLFGDYEDAIVEDQNSLYHSVLTPMLNVGLITPQYVVTETLKYAKANNIPINSSEGFIRQVIGWREFMRATYIDLGVEMRTTNHWQHTRPLPNAFYDASTGILPVDNAIERVLKTGYCHHIERLMVLGGFMFLCEINPDEIYKWFMEMFIDSYDWVMVPNVYAMSQNADGGNITTKPYFSGSNYVIKMSHYKKGEWSIIWDALFWRWIIKNSEALKGNPRWAMMVRNAEKMDETKKAAHLSIAENYFKHLFPGE